MNEAETRAELIDPALRDAGWGVVDGSRVRREAVITIGRLTGNGKRALRSHPPRKEAETLGTTAIDCLIACVSHTTSSYAHDAWKDQR